MKRNITQLIFAVVLMIGILMIATVGYAANQLENKQIKQVEQSLKRELLLMHGGFEWRSSVNQVKKQIATWKDQTDLRITWIQPDGTVLMDTDNNAADMDNHANRPEILAAKAGNGTIGYDTRVSLTEGKRLVYAARAMEVDGKIVGYLRLSAPTTEIDSAIQRLWTITLVGLFLALVIAALIGYRLGFRWTKMLSDINYAAEQIMRMNFNVKVNVPIKDEIGHLGLTINTIAENFHRQMGRILESERQLSNVVDNMVSGVLLLDQEGKFVLMNRTAENMLGFRFDELRGKLFFDSHQQTEFLALVAEAYDRETTMQEELLFYYPRESMMNVNIVPMYQQSNKPVGMLIVLTDVTDIRRLEKMRSEFVANVSHELKTPIAAIKGFSETLLSGALQDPSTSEAFLKIIFDESNRLDRLVMDILDLSKMESKRIPLFFAPIQLRGFVNAVFELVQAEADSRKITLSNAVEEGFYLEADEDRLRQILLNLIANGIHYSPGGEKVMVQAELYKNIEDGKDWVRITVEDTGLGIPKKDLPRIFERFYRVDKARSRVSGGTGLGLSIVKHLVELHHGQISVQSSLGVGSKFIVDLPLVHE
jgi:two-component system phosphate regulon sensor histidine kinase PhoR